MNSSFYAAAVSASQQQERLNVHGNNIANVNTFGYKAEKPAFTQLMYRMVDGIDDSLLPTGVGSRLDSAETNFRQEGLRETRMPYDYAIYGNGFFALMDPDTGDYSYTRDGSFAPALFRTAAQGGGNQVESRWYLSDGLGRYVMGQDGRPIEIQNPGQTPEIGESLDVGVFDFINYNGMQHLGDGRFVPVEKNGQVQRSNAQVIQGYIEASNTDLADELAKVIETQRAFSYMLRMVTTSDEIETTVNSLR